MNVVDTNILVYAVNENAHQHSDTRNWLDQHLSRKHQVGFTWGVILGFLRLITHPKIFSTPLSADQAIRQLATWLSAPGAVILEPSPMHLHHIAKLIEQAGSAGDLVPDAQLAAFATEHQATVVSYDNDFDRFPGIVRITP